VETSSTISENAPDSVPLEVKFPQDRKICVIIIENFLLGNYRQIYGNENIFYREILNKFREM
jgi:hypothetical protein